jgi:hypothetical protein
VIAMALVATKLVAPNPCSYRVLLARQCERREWHRAAFVAVIVRLHFGIDKRLVPISVARNQRPA